IIPMVLGGESMPLDLGRERRLFSKHQKIALDHQYQGCAAETCDLPPSRVEYHHTNPWHQGGRTDLAHGLPLCPPHHHMADHPTLWDMRRLPTGAIRFTRRT
ncbi:MAG TPA: HNH endonuclease signature motif containing protein, partial [Nocardioides sp.]|nr:HNH endonuclease signature motif containing protein [Nocardioides sp.]